LTKECGSELQYPSEITQPVAHFRPLNSTYSHRHKENQSFKVLRSRTWSGTYAYHLLRWSFAHGFLAAQLLNQRKESQTLPRSSF